MRLFHTLPDVPPGYSREQSECYRKLRLQALISVFLCYSAYYLVRKNFIMVMPDLAQNGFCKSDMGLILATMAVFYGLSNALMGFMADRVNTRWLMPSCLLGSAFLSLVIACLPLSTCPVVLMAAILGLNGWLQGLGWPASAKIVAHWFRKEERGRATGFCHLSQNLGAGLLGPVAILAVAFIGFWQAKLVLPAIVAIVVALLVFIWLRERPEDCNLPTVHSDEESAVNLEGNPFSFATYYRECLTLPALWLLALINACVYFIRYGVIDWVPLYMTDVKHFSFYVASWSFSAFEFAAIPGTLLCGFLSDRVFHGRRVPVNLLYMSLVLLALMAYWHSGEEHWLPAVIALVMTGFLIYGPLTLIHVHVIDLVPLRFAAASCGFCGLFGYFLGATLANLMLGNVIDLYGWDRCFHLLVGAGGLALIMLLILWRLDNNRLGPVAERSAISAGEVVGDPATTGQQFNGVR